MKTLSCILSILFSFQFLYSQHYEFKTIEHKPGVKSDQFRCFYKDNPGFMWFGTNNGLYRYNGDTYDQFFHIPGDTTSLSNNQINVMLEDSSGVLWIGTNYGLNRFNKHTNKFQWFFHSREDSSTISNNWIKDLILLTDGTFFVSTREGINKMVTGKNGKTTFEHYFPQRLDTTSTSEWSGETMYEDDNGIIWLGTWGGGIIEFDPDKGTFNHFYPPYPVSSINDHSIVSIEGKNDSIIWASAYNGIIYTFNIREKKFTVDPYKHPFFRALIDENLSIYTLKRDNDDRLWIGASNGLCVYHPESNKVEHSGANLNNRNNGSKIKDQAMAIYEDDQNLMWIGYGGGGVEIYDQEYKRFNKWRYALNSPEQYRDYLTGIRIDNHENVWLSTWGDGLIKVTFDGKVKRRFDFSKITSSSSSNIITRLELDIRGKLWASTSNGLFRFDPVTEKVTKVLMPDPEDPASFTDNHFFKLYCDNNGLIWVFTQECIRLLDPIKIQVKRSEIVDQLTLKKITCILKDNHDNYWFGASNGVAKYDSKYGTYTYFKNDPSNPNSLCSNDIKCLYEDSKGSIWIGTGGGTSKYDPKNERFHNFYDTEELSIKTVSSITEDFKGRIWIATYSDLTVYDPGDSSLATYNNEDGLSSKATRIETDKYGYLQMCAEKEFYRIFPDSIYSNDQVPPVYITGLYLSGATVQVNQPPLEGKSIMYKKQITLKHTQNNFGFSFRSLNFKHPQKNQYMYKLEGYHDSWISNGTKNEVSFMNLSPGTYNFLVKGSNDDLKWNESPAQVKIEILPPPWRTWWAYSIYSLLIALTVFSYRRYTILREREKNKTKMDEMKLSFFINISHELRTPLTLITGPLERIIQKENDYQKKDKLALVYRNASRLQQLVNQLLDIRKLEVGKLKPVIYQSDFKLYLNVILESFKTYAEDNQMNLNIHNDLTDNHIWFDPDILEKVLSNLLINAFKYTSRNGNVWLTVRNCEQGQSQSMFQKLSKTMHQVKSNQKILSNVRYITLEIADSGAGLEPSDLEKIFNRFYQNNAFKRHSSISSGIGLSLVKDLVDRIHGFIFVQSEVGLGTRFLLFLPVERKAFPNAYIHDQKDEIEFYSKDYSNVLTTEPIIRNKEIELPESQPDQKKKSSILIVDDNKELLDYISDILSESYHVKTAPDGEAGMKKAINNKFDLIISDIMMPVMDGLQFCSEIKNDVRTSHIPVILLTAKKTIESEVEGLDTGADDYITKPFHPNLLMKRVRNIIANREKIWEKMASDTEIIPQGLALTTKDEDFLEKAIHIIEENLSDSEFNQEIFCREIGMSKASLYRKINSLTNQSINEFVRNVRLKKAAEILRCGKQIHIAELAYRMGFSEPSYFTKKFREYFSITPKEYNNRYIKKEEVSIKINTDNSYLG